MKKTKVLLGLAIAMVLSFASITPANALRVLDYTYNCVGSGGNCLDDVIITPKKQL